MKVLVLESSTASAKAMLYDSEKGIIKSESVTYDESVCDIVTQDANGVVDAVLRVGASVASGQEIEAVALSGIWHSFLICDSAYRPKSRIYTWAFIGASKQAEKVRADAALSDEIYQKTGCAVNALYPLYKAMLLKDQIGKDDKVMAQGDYLFYSLTGEYLTSDCLASGSAMLDLKAKDYDDGLLKFCGLSREQLPEIVDYKKTAPLSEKAAAVLGIKAGIPVVTAHSDGAMNQVGAGATKKGVMTFSVGTSSAIRLVSDTPVTPQGGGTWCYLAPGSYLVGAATQGSTNCVDWFAGGILGGAKKYRELEDPIEFKDDNPYFLPFIFGERCPGWNDKRKGGFYGIGPSHKDSDLFYAILEGVLFNVFHCYKILTDVAKEPDVIKLSGGIVKSPVWSKMLTSIWQREFTIDKTDQASMLGGAALALHAAGGLSDIRAFGGAGERQLLPDKELAGYFEKRFENYLKLYKGAM